LIKKAAFARGKKRLRGWKRKEEKQTAKKAD
jgi:hypothetical protein